MNSALFSALMLCCLTGYLLSGLLYPVEVFLNRKQVATVRRSLLFAAALLHLGGMIAYDRHADHSLFAGADGTALFFGWAMAVGLMIFERRSGRTMVGMFVVPVVFLISLYAFGCPEAGKRHSPSLHSYWLYSHVAIIVLGYVCFTLASCYAAMYLLKERFLKHKKMTGVFRLLPSLQTADAVVYYMTATGLSLLTVGIVSGVIRAHVAQPDYQPWQDAKVVLSMALWLLYAGYFFARRVLGWRGRKVNLVNVLTFFVMLSTFFAQHHLPISLQH